MTKRPTTAQPGEEIEEVRAEIDPSVLDRLINGYGEFPKAVAEIVFNSIDAGADEVWLRFVKEGSRTDLQVIDNGHGINAEGRKATCSLAVSTARRNPRARGRNGTGRLGGLLHCEEIVYETRDTPSGPLRTTVLSRTGLLESWFKSGTSEWRSKPLPIRHPIRATGTMVTWRNLGQGSGVNARKPRTSKLIREQLSAWLPPYAVEKVTVVDEQGQKHKLQGRELAPGAQPIMIERHGVPHLGDVTVSISVVADAKGSYDRLEIGPFGPVCPITDLFGRIQRDPRFESYAHIMRVLWNTLGHPKCVGLVDVSALKPYRGNDSGGFEDTLFDDVELIAALIEFLRTAVVPLVEKALGTTADQISTTNDDTLVADIVSKIQAATGAAPRAITRIESDTTRRRLEVELHQSYLLEVPNPEEGVEYAWDDSDARGRVSTRKGHSTTYTPTSVGDARLRVRRVGAPKDAPPVMEWQIVVLTTLPLRFRERSITVDTGERRLLVLEHTHHVKGSLIWSVRNSGGTVKVKPDTFAADYTSGEIEGDWTIEVEDSADRNRRAVCTVKIEAGHSTRAKRRPASMDMFDYEGQTFVVRVSRVPGPEAARHMSQLFPGEFSRIVLNWLHPSYEGLVDPALVALSIDQIARRVVQRTRPQATVEESMQESAMLLARFRAANR